MGRTLHYEIPYQHAETLIDRDWDAIHALAEQYQRNFQWTCETVELDPYSYYPRWPQSFKNSALPELDPEDTWELLHREYSKLRAAGKGHTQAVSALVRHRLAALHHEQGKPIYTDAQGSPHEPTGVGGFTKVRDNEWNALLVYRFLLDISRLFPQIEITLHDEGRFLLCPLVIRNGAAKPDKALIQESLDYWHEKEAETPGFIAAWVEQYDTVKAFADWPSGKWEAPDFFARRVDPAHFERHPERGTVNVELGDPEAGQKLAAGMAEIFKEFEGNYFRATGQL